MTLMCKHWRYLKYVATHKWYVFLECWKLGIPWQGIIHDLSKFRPSEWFPYVEYFYGPKKPKLMDTHGEARQVALNTGYYHEIGIVAFDTAWLKHQHRNPHHWQYWVLSQDDDGIKVLDMPDKYRKEMLADWRGAGKAQGKPDTAAWYKANKHKMKLSPKTRFWIESRLGTLKYQTEFYGVEACRGS